MRVLRADMHRRMPWKNGGGTTTEIVLGPEDADFDSFRWRASMADIAVDGPFSLLPGIDRTFAVVQGNGVRLTIGDAQPIVLRCDSKPVVFSGDEAVKAALIDGPTVDLNVMSRRDRCRHALRVMTLPESGTVILQSNNATEAVLVALSDNMTVSDVGELRSGDAVVLSRNESVAVTALKQARFGWIELFY